MVFHCSAGVGRTGTLISLMNIMLIIRQYQEILNEDDEKCTDKFKISVFDIVRRMREQRFGINFKLY